MPKQHGSSNTGGINRPILQHQTTSFHFDTITTMAKFSVSVADHLPFLVTGQIYAVEVPRTLGMYRWIKLVEKYIQYGVEQLHTLAHLIVMRVCVSQMLRTVGQISLSRSDVANINNRRISAPLDTISNDQIREGTHQLEFMKRFL